MSVCCQTPQLGTEVDIGPGHIVLDGAQLSPPPGKGHNSLSIFSAPNGRPSQLLLSACWKSAREASLTVFRLSSSAVRCSIFDLPVLVRCLTTHCLLEISTCQCVRVCVCVMCLVVVYVLRQLWQARLTRQSDQQVYFQRFHSLSVCRQSADASNTNSSITRGWWPAIVPLSAKQVR